MSRVQWRQHVTTETRPDPPDSAAIVGEDLEQSLVDAGVTAPHARALRAAVELIVLRMRGTVATKDDLMVVKDDLRREIDGLRREMRWTGFLIVTVFGGMLIALLTRTF